MKLELFANSSRHKPGSGVESWDDGRLIAECLAGDQGAFGVLVSRYQDRLFNTVYRLLENLEDAQDVTQESFVSAYQSLASFKGDAQFFTWLYRIAVNAAISLRRKKRATVSLDSTKGQTHSFQPVDESRDTQPGASLERMENEEQIRWALGRLSVEHRAVVVLKDIEELRYEEIAEILKVPIGTVRSRLHRARLELRELLERFEQGSKNRDGSC
jgi:RNA polymerase sigma-70 factor (ECF subfamily)